MSLRAAAMLLWIEHRHGLRSCGYSFTQLEREIAARLKRLLASPSQFVAPSARKPAGDRESFDRRDLRVRW